MGKKLGHTHARADHPAHARADHPSTMKRAGNTSTMKREDVHARADQPARTGPFMHIGKLQGV